MGVYTVSREQIAVVKNRGFMWKVRAPMFLVIVIIAVALFVMAFIGLNRMVPTLFGLGCIVGIIFSLYLMYIGFINSNESKFIWGCLLLLAAGSVLVYLKSAWSD